MNTSLYRLLTIQRSAHQCWLVPRPQLLGMKFVALTDADLIELRLSVARVIVQGRGLAPLWAQLVSDECDCLMQGEVSGGGKITFIDFLVLNELER